MNITKDFVMVTLDDFIMMNGLKKMIKINNPETKQFITTNPKELVESIQKYQSKILFLISVGEINRKMIIFSNIGYGE